MKIALVCNSVLLNESLKIFLKPYLTNLKDANIVISDQKLDIDKPVFIINNKSEAHLQKPFSMSNLLLSLEHFYKDNKVMDKYSFEDDKQLKYDIEVLVKDFTDNLYKLIKERTS
jgi:hypothetical protein